MKQNVIVGAGITGLTIGYELAKKGQKVVILEKEDVTGGLAKSFKYNGFSFDIGPHRFFTDKEQPLKFIREILKGQSISLSRDSRVYFKGKYYSWPLRSGMLFHLPLNIQVKAARDLFFRVNKKDNDANTFEGHILNNYGPTLYNCFFKDYTQKFFNISPDYLDADWAKSGMEKAIIDKDLPHRDLWRIIKLAMRPLPDCTKFLYPKGGMMAFCDKMAWLIKQNGGRILTGVTVLGVNSAAGQIKGLVTNKGDFDCSNLIWTAPVRQVCGFLGVPELGLKYLSLLLYNVLINGNIKEDFQWSYFGEKEILFNRVSIPSMFDPGSASGGKTGLCVEVTCQEGQDIWHNAEKLTRKIMANLKDVGLLRERDIVDSVHIEKVSNAYPIYDLNYRQRLCAMQKNLSRFENLIVAGRTGAFWYNNMDECIIQGLSVADKLIKGSRKINPDII